MTTGGMKEKENVNKRKKKWVERDASEKKGAVVGGGW